MTPMPIKPDPTDVTDTGWTFAASYLRLLDPEAPQRRHNLREVVNALRWIVPAGSPCRMLPTTVSPLAAVHEQIRR